MDRDGGGRDEETPRRKMVGEDVTEGVKPRSDDDDVSAAALGGGESTPAETETETELETELETETTETDKLAPLSSNHHQKMLLMTKKKKKAHTPSFENWLIEDDVFGPQDVSDTEPTTECTEPAELSTSGKAEAEAAREVEGEPRTLEERESGEANRNHPIPTTPPVSLLEPMPELEPMTLVSGDDPEVETGRSRSLSLAGSPNGQVDEEALKLYDLIGSLKATLAREECVGRQRHEGEFLLQKGQDLLAQRRAQAALNHVTPSSTSGYSGDGDNNNSKNHTKKKNAFEETLSAAETEESFLRRIKQIVNTLLECSFKGGDAQSEAGDGGGGEGNAVLLPGQQHLKVVYDNEHVWKLCSLVEAFLSKGMRAQPLHPLEDKLQMPTDSPRSSPRKGRGKWIKGLRWMVSKPQPFNVLYAAEQYGVDLGLKVITPRQNRSIKGVNKLHAWVRNCLIEGTLASRLDILVQQQSFLKVWYDDSAIIRSEDSYSYLVGSLKPLKELQFNILLWPAQEFQSEPKNQYFSASRLRERKNEILLFEKSVTQFQDQEKLVTVIGEHSPGLHDIDEILSSPVSPSKQGRGKGKKHSKKSKNKKRLVGASEIGQEKLERAEQSKALDAFSFDQAFSLHANAALRFSETKNGKKEESDPLATKVGFEVQPSRAESHPSKDEATRGEEKGALFSTNYELDSNSVPPPPAPPPSALSLNMNLVGKDEHAPHDNHTSSSSLRSESSLSLLSGRESSHSGAFNLSLEDIEMLSPRLVDLDLDRTVNLLEKSTVENEAMMDNLESQLASSLDMNPDNFLLDKYEIATAPENHENEEEKVLEELEIARDAKRLEDNEHHRHAEAAATTGAANVNVVGAETPHTETYEDIMSQLPDVPKRTVESRQEEGKGGEDSEMESSQFGCGHFGTDYLMDDDEKAYANKQQQQREEVEVLQEETVGQSKQGSSAGLGEEATESRVGVEDDKLFQEPPSSALHRMGEDERNGRASSESQAEGSTEQSELTDTSVDDLHTLSELQSVLLGSEERQAKSHGTLSSVDRGNAAPGAAGILNVGILGMETHGDRWTSYTVYQVYVQSSSGPSWLLRKRYSDFVQLHKELKHLFRASSLPKPWEEIKLDKFLNFGHLRFNASVIEERRELLQECLRVTCSSPPPLCTAEPLLRFLSPETGEHGILEEIGFNGSNQKELAMKGSGFQEGEGGRGRGEMMMSSSSHGGTGQSVRLLVEEPRPRATLEQLQIQHGRCAGCSCRIRGGASAWPLGNLVSLGGLSLNPLNKTQQHRTCEYTRQLYCSKCHSNDKAVLPWSVLQEWDFKPRKVSSVVQEYLSSIFDQPILCISAIKPQLYGRIPLLNKLREQRITLHKRFLQLSGTKYEQALVHQLGAKSYLVENTEFWSMKDLVDISKGAFAELPAALNHVAATLQQLTWDHLKNNLSQSSTRQAF